MQHPFVALVRAARIAFCNLAGACGSFCIAPILAPVARWAVAFIVLVIAS